MKQLEIQNFARLKLKHHIENHKEPDVNIIFVFRSKHFNFNEKIWIFGSIQYKGINFDRESAIMVIPNNFYYSDFDFVAETHRTTPVRCHGFGDNWATEIHRYIFERKETK